MKKKNKINNIRNIGIIAHIDVPNHTQGHNIQANLEIDHIAQSGSDLSPCNRHHIFLAERVREGIREAGGIVSGLDGSENYLDAGHILCGTPKIYAGLAKLCAQDIKAVLNAAR